MAKVTARLTQHGKATLKKQVSEDNFMIDFTKYAKIVFFEK